MLIVTDAWKPQINGVVRSLERVSEVLEADGLKVHFLTPLEFNTVPMPGYGEIRLSITTRRRVFAMIDRLAPDAIHIATEGPLGFIARRYCMKRGVPFATSYHTQFPEYLRARVPVPVRFTYDYLRRFHEPARYCLVPTRSIAERLVAHGFRNVVLWSRGVDTHLYDPAKRKETLPEGAWPRPWFLYVGRVSVEKNIEAFLRLDLPGTKLVVGEGPSRKTLMAHYPRAVFTGARTGEALATLYASADCFVFPSRTDTFGLVLLEALASGTPVAAYPVPGPLDVVGNSGAGVLSEDLGAAARAALQIPREYCRRYAEGFTWAESAAQFRRYLPQISVKP
ncbi:glycosyltransferase family 4 protein [Arsenicitalea aurantiaca]|uniref:glycosyltransferase family 4 protein n=1 Tax=Arsenicitalea aurantiaca TaxID=1783274 RepID=UPI001FCE4989|nr:glycosyltransferase family 1 protein [Arsenicitalea aurantiaca]